LVKGSLGSAKEAHGTKQRHPRVIKIIALGNGKSYNVIPFSAKETSSLLIICSFFFFQES
jgi:hypothetical protein